MVPATLPLSTQLLVGVDLEGPDLLKLVLLELCKLCDNFLDETTKRATRTFDEGHCVSQNPLVVSPGPRVLTEGLGPGGTTHGHLPAERQAMQDPQLRGDLHGASSVHPPLQ